MKINKSGKESVVVVVGLQPPPIHGLSFMNARVAELVSHGHIRVVMIDLAVHQSCGGITFAVRRIYRAAAGAVHLIAGVYGADQRVLYMGLSGGLGQAIDLGFILLSHLLSAKLIIHHHNFCYLDRPNMLSRAVFRASGLSTTHVALCCAMKLRIQAMYGEDLNVLVVPNAALLGADLGERVDRHAMRTVGFLGNLMRDKGIDTFLEVAQSMSGSGLRFQVAGPFMNSQIEREVRERLAGLPNVSYYGPVYGAKKVEFLRETDVLLFPSRLNEADPLTIWEALSYSTPVIATDRGCIRSTLHSTCGVVTDTDHFAVSACTQLMAWKRAKHDYQQASISARYRYETVFADHQQQAAELLSKLHVSSVAAILPGSPS